MVRSLSLAALLAVFALHADIVNCACDVNKPETM